jgi:deoxycytidine triphosphate deaminase
MFLNPKDLLEKKIITYPADIDINKHVQQNGIDVDCIRIDNINFEAMPIVGKDVNHKPDVKEEPVAELTRYNMMGWRLKKGNTYTFESSFEIAVPDGMCGWVIGRSTFNRQGILIRSSLYDSGFKGKIGGTIYCFNNIAIEQGARVGQIVLASASSAGMYSGQYQS